MGEYMGDDTYSTIPAHTVTMASPAIDNISADLIWEVVRNNNSFLTKSKRNGGVQFSRDPLNLINKNTRKHAGFVNDKAIGIVRNEKGFTVITKKPSAPTKPKEAFLKSEHSGNNSSRKAYKSVANQTAKRIPPRSPRGCCSARVSYPPVPAPRQARTRDQASWQAGPEG